MMKVRHKAKHKLPPPKVVYMKSSLRHTLYLLSGIYSVLLASPTFALPDQADVVTGLTPGSGLAGDAIYQYDPATDPLNASLSASTNSIVQVNDTTTDGVIIAAGETLNVSSTGGAINILLEIVDAGMTANPSQILGSIAGDNNVSLFIQDTDGLVFGSDSSVTNLAALIATTHSITDAEFIGFDQSNPLNLSAEGGTIQLNGLDFNGSQLVLIADVVNVDGVVVSSGQINVAIGDTVELALPGSGGLLNVDVTQALTNAAGDNLRVAEGSSVTAAGFDAEASIQQDLNLLAVNLEGTVRSNAVLVGEDGQINIVSKGGAAQLSGELDADSGQGEINLIGDDIVIDADIVAARLDVGLGDATRSAVARNGSLNVDGMRFANPEIDVTGVAGFEHAVSGFGNYEVRLEPQLNGPDQQVVRAGFGSGNNNDWRTGPVLLQNIENLTATNDIDNVISIRQGTSIASITGGNGADTFIVEGMAGNLFGSGANDVFDIQGGTVNFINGGGGPDILLNVIQLDANDNPTGMFDGNNVSSNVASWTSIFSVVPFVLPPIPAEPDPLLVAVPDNLLAGNPEFMPLAAAGASSLAFAGDDALRAPCSANASFAANTQGANKQGSTVADDVFTSHAGDEPCLDSPEYLAMLSSTIYFDHDSSEILSPAANKLNRVSDFILEYKHFNEVSVSGHTDSVGTDNYNLELSARRANAAADYLQRRGVDGALLKTYFFGESLPTQSNETQANRAKNRRVVVELKR